MRTSLVGCVVLITLSGCGDGDDKPPTAADDTGADTAAYNLDDVADHCGSGDPQPGARLYAHLAFFYAETPIYLTDGATPVYVERGLVLFGGTTGSAAYDDLWV